MGQIIEYIKMAIYNILSNKGRSFLTMLGIIIGISSVITVVSIGSGVKEEMLESTEEKSVAIAVNGDETINTQIITQDDLVALKNQLGERTKGVVASMSASGTTETNKGKFDAYITFTTPDGVNDPNEKELLRGAYFTEEDLNNVEPKCIIDRASALSLFGDLDVVGMNVEVLVENKIQSVQIIGVRDTDEEMMKANQEAADMLGITVPIYFEMPYTTYELWGMPVGNYSAISVYLASGENGNSVAKAAIKILDTRHINDGENLFEKQQGMDMMNYMSTMMDMLTAFIAFVAGISLLVGGIGVMNIMLVSVTERTREIGIRKSLGAKTSSIVTQFLFESAIISGIGGIIGIISGASIAALISALNIGGLSSKLSVGAIIIATCFSCGVGLLFGIYPARKAAKLSPIEALRQL
ncbi:putative ABC transport system permease protein [Aequitasia blattaphilus]|uniref:ABC transporter permease n=1 Tax=Aequitasia blattaphilus TaxID=2949332 RepID=A0ABT1E9J1_9FIRM|nr:ABC transporter permease [Aequitasia blattaphilus]MCP1102453.1 ABC transporter permease [Aequitasia blattaphilus]MCR8615093.1 ABC transporter permease [Aequitasia blattaphilus]